MIAEKKEITANNPVTVDSATKLLTTRKAIAETNPRHPVSSHDRIFPVRSFNLKPKNTIEKKHIAANRKLWELELALISCEIVPSANESQMKTKKRSLIFSRGIIDLAVAGLE